MIRHRGVAVFLVCLAPLVGCEGRPAEPPAGRFAAPGPAGFCDGRSATPLPGRVSGRLEGLEGRFAVLGRLLDGSCEALPPLDGR